MPAACPTGACQPNAKTTLISKEAADVPNAPFFFATAEGLICGSCCSRLGNHTAASVLLGLSAIIRQAKHVAKYAVNHVTRSEQYKRERFCEQGLTLAGLATDKPW